MRPGPSMGRGARGLSITIRWRRAISAWPGRPHVDLLETLVEELVGVCFAAPAVQACRVSVVKPDIFNEVAAVGVEVFRGAREVKGAALVTGGAVRIGAVIARRLAREGYAVGVHAHRSIEKAETLATELRAQGFASVALGADLSDREAVGGLVARLRRGAGTGAAAGQ